MWNKISTIKYTASCHIVHSGVPACRLESRTNSEHSVMIGKNSSKLRGVMLFHCMLSLIQHCSHDRHNMVCFPRYWFLWGEFTGHRENFHLKGPLVQLWCFLWCYIYIYIIYNRQTKSRDGSDLRRSDVLMWSHRHGYSLVYGGTLWCKKALDTLWFAPAWWHRSITCTDVDVHQRSFDGHLRRISPEITETLINVYILHIYICILVF